MSANFFGQFLLERGTITPEQLMAAVAIQETTNVLLGTRAIDAGYMTVPQVEEINALQRTLDRRFGELALERGYLKKAQLDELLNQQKELRLMLGEALIKTGALDNARLAAELAAFKPEGVPKTIGEIYSGRAHADVLEVIADVTAKMFLRILHTIVRPAKCNDVAGRTAGCNFTIHQRIKGDVNAMVGLDVSTSTVKHAATVLLGMDVTVIDADAIDAASEFLNIVCGNVCSRLSAKGLKVDLEPPRVHAWSDGPFDLTASIDSGGVTRTPLLHPTEAIELVVIV